jgi:hypothetical protein
MVIGANHYHPPIPRPMANLITGQVEALLPSLLAAMDAEKAAKAHAADLKAQLAAILESPQTVKTVWGSVTLNKGRRTVEVIGKALKAKITLLKEEGIVSGESIENMGDPFISVRKSDR